MEALLKGAWRFFLGVAVLRGVLDVIGDFVDSLKEAPPEQVGAIIIGMGIIFAICAPEDRRRAK